MAVYFGQTIDEKLSQAEDYFASDNHIQHLDWAEYTEDEKKAGLNQAEREVNLYLGINLEENYDDTDWPVDWNKNFRPDYACMEQAFFILENTARTKTGGDGAEMIESEEYQREERAHGVGLSPQATRYLRMNRLQLDRG